MLKNISFNCLPTSLRRFVGARKVSSAASLIFAISAIPAIANAAPLSQYQGTFSALQYNVSGLPFGYNADQDPNKNIPYIAPLLNKYDIVNIQEDWDQKFHNTLYKASTHTFKSDRHGNGGFFGTDGLETLTNFTVVPSNPAKPDALVRVKFDSCGGNFIECFAGKGFSVARVKVGNGGVIDVYNTHTVAGDSAAVLAARASNIHQLSDFMSTYSKDNAVLVMADTNARYTRGTDDLRYLLNQNGLRDPWVDLKRSGTQPAAGAPATPCEPGSNGAPNPSACEVVDKMLYRGSTSLELNALTYQLNDPVFYNPDTGKSLSDHYPLITTFGYNAMGAVPEPASWVLMIVGFGAVGGIGGILRRRKAGISLA